MKCPECQGLGYREYESGLIRLPCWLCKGSGDIEDVLTIETLRKAVGMPASESSSKEYLEVQNGSYIPPEEIESIELPKGLEEVLSDVTYNSVEPSNQPGRIKNTSKSKLKRKPKKSKVA